MTLRPANSERTGRDQPLQNHQRLGEDDADGRSRRVGGTAGIEPSMGKARRAHRSLYRLGVSAVRALLHHRDAPPRGRKRHHHREPSLLLRRLGDEAGTEFAADAGVLPDAGVSSLTRRMNWKTWPPITSASSVSNLRVGELLRDVDRTLRQDNVLAVDVYGSMFPVASAPRFFFSRAFPPGEGSRFEFENRVNFWKKMATISRPAGSSDAARAELQGFRTSRTKFTTCRRAEELRVQLGFILESTDATRCSGSNGGVSARSADGSNMFCCKPLRSMFRIFCAHVLRAHRQRC